jgi:hypothetical protein
VGQRPKAKHNFSARCLWFVPQHSLSLLVAQVRRSPYGYLKMVGWCKILRPSAGTGPMDGQTGRRHGQRFAILHAKEKNDIVLRCGPSPCLSRARLPSQTEAALPDVCSPTVRYGTVPIYPSQPFSGFRLCFRTRILKTFGSCITPTKICTCSRMKHGNQESL